MGRNGAIPRNPLGDPDLRRYDVRVRELLSARRSSLCGKTAAAQACVTIAQWRLLCAPSEPIYSPSAPTPLNSVPYYPSRVRSPPLSPGRPPSEPAGSALSAPRLRLLPGHAAFEESRRSYPAPGPPSLLGRRPLKCQ